MTNDKENEHTNNGDYYICGNQIGGGSSARASPPSIFLSGT
jgi:hypothetical protein